MIHRHGGIQLLSDIFALIGWNWPLLILPWLGITLATVFAYRTALPERGKAISFRLLFQIERAGNALNTLVPLGNHGGQIVKLSILRHWFPSHALVSAALWCTMGTGLMNLVAALGPLAAAIVGHGEPWVVQAMGLISASLAIPSASALFLVRHDLSRRFSSLIAKIPLRLIRARREGLDRWSSSPRYPARLGGR